MTERIMFGHSDLSGKFFGSVKAVALASRWPAPKYHVHCGRCGSAWTENQQRLVHAGQAYTCKNKTCAAQSEEEKRRDIISGNYPNTSNAELETVGAMAVDETTVGLLRAGLQGIKR